MCFCVTQVPVLTLSEIGFLVCYYAIEANWAMSFLRRHRCAAVLSPQVCRDYKLTLWSWALGQLWGSKPRSLHLSSKRLIHWPSSLILKSLFENIMTDLVTKWLVFIIKVKGWPWWYTPFIQALRRQRKWISVSSRPTQRDCLKTNKSVETSVSSKH